MDLGRFPLELDHPHPSRLPSAPLSYRPLQKFFLDDLTLKVDFGSAADATTQFVFSYWQ